MSRKDVLHIPLPVERPSERHADTDERPHREVPIMTPDEGPGHTPSITHSPRIITPAGGTPGRYPGVSVT